MNVREKPKMTKSNLGAIPASVLALLKHQWVKPDGYSAHAAVFERYPDRRSRPAYYVYRKGTDFNGWGNVTHAEAVWLVRDNVFPGLMLDDGRGISVNEHAQHALDDFCRDVYGAWAKFQARLLEIQIACPRMAD